jgi:hypothetical protein
LIIDFIHEIVEFFEVIGSFVFQLLRLDLKCVARIHLLFLLCPRSHQTAPQYTTEKTAGEDLLANIHSETTKGAEPSSLLNTIVEELQAKNRWRRTAGDEPRPFVCSDPLSFFLSTGTTPTKKYV